MGLALLSLTLAGCHGEAFDQTTWMERGGQELAPLKTQLMGALTESLEEGPEAAIDACKLVAPAIAHELSTPGMELGRTSHKLRNPDNAPRTWVQPLLAAYVTTAENTTPTVVQLGNGGVGYVEPIFVQPQCLTCHGSALAPDIAARLDSLYPNDQARGFEVGDFRGLFWVEFSDVERASD